MNCSAIALTWGLPDTWHAQGDPYFRDPLDRPVSPTVCFLHKGSGQTHRLSKASTTGHQPTNKTEKTLMDKKNLMPQAAQPVNRISTGQLPDVLAELSEEALQLHGESAHFSSASVLASLFYGGCGASCSYDGDDAE